MSELLPAPPEAVAADPALQVEFTNQAADLQLLVRHGWRWWAPLSMVGAALACSLPGAVVLVVYGHEHTAGGISACIVACALWLLYRSWQVRPVHAKFLIRRRIVLTPERFWQRTAGSWGCWRWAWMREVVDFEDSLLIGLEHGWWVIPNAAFATPEHRARFRQELVDRRRDLETPSGNEPLPAAEPVRDSLTVEFRNSPRERSAVQVRGGQWQVWLVVGAVFVGAWVGMTMETNGEARLRLISELSAMLLHVVSVLIMVPVISRIVTWYTNPSTWRERLHERATLTPAGVQLTTAFYNSFAQWTQFDGVEEDDRSIYIVFAKAVGQQNVIPKSAFPNQAEAGRFLAAAREYLERAKAEREHAAKQAPTGAAVPRSQESGNPYQPPST